MKKHKHNKLLIVSVFLGGIFFAGAIVCSVFAFHAKKEDDKQSIVNNISINEHDSIIHDTCFIPKEISHKPSKSMRHKKYRKGCDTIYKYVTVNDTSK